MCGYLRNGIYRKHVNKSKHLFKAMDAWGIDKAIVDDLKILGCKTIRIKEHDENVIYTVEFSTFCELGVERTFQDTQIFLPLGYWITEKPLK